MINSQHTWRQTRFNLTLFLIWRYSVMWRVSQYKIYQPVQWRNCFGGYMWLSVRTTKVLRRFVFGFLWWFLVVLDNQTTTITQAALVCPGWSFVCRPYAFSWGALGKKWKFLSRKDKNPSKKNVFYDPLVDLKKRPEAMPKFLIGLCICGIFATVSLLRGTRWVPWWI